MSRVFLVLISLIFSLLLAEALLQTYGWALKAASRDNRSTQADEVVILALGESTTAPSDEEDWPAQLELLLAKKFPQQKIKVLNRGVIGTNTGALLAQAAQDIETDQPRIIIAMMGINDLYFNGASQSEFITNSSGWTGATAPWYHQLKLYKLGQLLVSTSQKVGREIQIAISRDAEWLNDQGVAAIDQGDLQKAEQYLQQAVRLKPLDSGLRISLSWLYQDLSREKEALEQINQAVALSPDTERAYVEAGILYRRYGRYQSSRRLFEKAFALNSHNAWTSVEFGMLMVELEEPVQAEQLFVWSFELDPDNPQPLIELANLLRDQKKITQARAAYHRALVVDPINERAKLELLALDRTDPTLAANQDADIGQVAGTSTEEYYHPMTVRNYQKLFQLAADNSIDVVAVQYPLRQVEPLQQLVKSAELSNNSQRQVRVVDNRESFQEALKQHSYDELFYDSFGGDFGHATKAGNAILAENIAQTVTEILSQYK